MNNNHDFAQINTVSLTLDGACDNCIFRVGKLDRVEPRGAANFRVKKLDLGNFIRYNSSKHHSGSRSITLLGPAHQWDQVRFVSDPTPAKWYLVTLSDFEALPLSTGNFFLYWCLLSGKRNLRFCSVERHGGVRRRIRTRAQKRSED
ncbi:MAG: hypothetical protein WC184_01995 [Acidimicrobiia bacterium]